MKVCIVSLLSSACLASIACSAPTLNDLTPSASSTPQSPVAATPLKGTVEGTPFVAVSALATSGSEGEKWINIYESSQACGGRADRERKILISLPWKAGTLSDFKFAFDGNDQTATFVIPDASGAPRNVVSVEGRVEVIAAPNQKGEKGVLRLRAKAGESSVEGEIAVEICD